MSTLGRIANSLTNINNENILTLANLNFDFTVFKFDAPKEFATIGNSLSLRRRADAEEGKIHKTARKLAALFESLVPSTPNLLKAYGTRSSEIASDPQANPKGSDDHGPFEEFIGIDGSSLWAAATSSAMTFDRHAAISMYLLACILARAWEADKSISIWTELVGERQAEIMKATEEGPQLTSTYMAACQDITREELAKWDASARSWLRSADEVKRVAYTKFMLIAKNISVNLCQSRSTYQNVVDVWRHALLGMEDLIQGRPQEASDGAVLLALSAWHIYPDLMILGSSTKSIEFDDPLVQAGGIITVGLQYAVDNGDAGMHWSLTLSQYQFYERKAKVSTGDGTSRITMDELLIMALGSLFSAWDVLKNEQTETANWLIKIFDLMHQSTDLPWLAVLVDASHKFLEMNQNDSARCFALVAYSRRRAKNLLGFQELKPQPFFGLRSYPLLRSLSLKPGSKQVIAYLRGLCETVNITGTHCLIRYRERWQGTTRTIFATALPRDKISTKRPLDRSPKREKRHYYWFPLGQKRPPCFECLAGSSGALAESQGRGACRFGELLDCQPGSACVYSEEMANEQCLEYDPQRITTNHDSSGETFRWYNAPAILREYHHSEYRGVRDMDLTFRLCYGDPQSFAIFAIVPVLRFSFGKRNSKTTETFESLEAALETACLAENTFLQASTMLEQKINPASLSQYLTWYGGNRARCAWLTHSRAIIRGNETFDVPEQPFNHNLGVFLKANLLDPIHYQALITLTKAQTVFAPFKELTVPLQAVSVVNLCDVQWFMNNGSVPFNIQLNISERLACIVGFESCFSKIRCSDLDNVFAVSFGNSIFVASELLTDPLNHKNCTDEFQRLAGNVGMLGISLLVPPRSSLKRTAPGYDLRLVPHNRYDHGRENNFQGTSLHLSFTSWREPLIIASQGTIDQNIFYVESVLSVHDRGKWVADFNIFGEQDFTRLQPPVGKWDFDCECTGDGNKAATSIDAWEEIIDPPENVGIIRAHNNWAARLAAQAVCLSVEDLRVFVVQPHRTFCVKCISRSFEKAGEVDSDRFIIID
ncbi:hypothetical protein LTR84_009755 [Exophiala bonariae]|uniref:Uncharacterized protein n=1 Tax=Exophiala bonariae TaxID=1690606 RepID=A0AAV9NJ66_9EURO|nr:hypothetical protein LTR84_009755 [Exophiala bonariae]